MEFLGVHYADKVHMWENYFNFCTSKEKKILQSSYKTSKNKDYKYCYKKNPTHASMYSLPTQEMFTSIQIPNSAE